MSTILFLVWVNHEARMRKKILGPVHTTPEKLKKTVRSTVHINPYRKRSSNLTNLRVSVDGNRFEKDDDVTIIM